MSTKAGSSVQRPRQIIRWTSGFKNWKITHEADKSGVPSVTLTSPTGRYDWSSDHPNARVVAAYFRVDSADDFAKGTLTVSWKAGGKTKSADASDSKIRTGLAGRMYLVLPDDADLSNLTGISLTVTATDTSPVPVVVWILSIYTPASTASFGDAPTSPAGALLQMRPRRGVTVAPPSDAVVASRVSELQAVLSWATKWERNVVLGEFGVPGTDNENSVPWQKLMDEYLDVADAAGLPLLRWSEGAGAPLAFYKSDGSSDSSGPAAVNVARTAAAAWERHVRAVPGRAVGVSLFSMCQALTTVGDRKYSNANTGAYGKDFKAENPDTVRYLASRGHNAFRLPFRWDRVMRDPDGGLDATQWGYYRRNVDAVMAQDGCIAVIDPHCSWGYRFAGEDSDTTSRITGPGTSLYLVQYAHLLRLVCADLDEAGYHGRYAIELTNEPHGQALSQWSNAEIAQFVVEDLRGDGNDTHMLIPFHPYDAARNIDSIYPWIDDPLGSLHHSYVVHHYFDALRSGQYNFPPYSQILQRQNDKQGKSSGGSGAGSGSGSDPGSGD